jgi:hypothetical protein
MQLRGTLLSLDEGLGFQLGLDLHTARLLPLLDGRRSLREALGERAAEMGSTRRTPPVSRPRLFRRCGGWLSSTSSLLEARHLGCHGWFGRVAASLPGSATPLRPTSALDESLAPLTPAPFEPPGFSRGYGGPHCEASGARYGLPMCPIARHTVKLPSAVERSGERWGCLR